MFTKAELKKQRKILKEASEYRMQGAAFNLIARNNVEQLNEATTHERKQWLESLDLPVTLQVDVMKEISVYKYTKLLSRLKK